MGVAAEAAPEVEEPTVDDLWQFVAGFHPLTRTKVLFRRLDLMAVRDELAVDLDEARIAEDAEKEEAILARIREVTAEMQSSRFAWKIRQLTDSRRVEILKEAEAAGEDTGEAALRLLAASTVEPAGISVDQIKELVEVVPNQMADLVTTMFEMAEGTPNPRLTSPF
nr:MAG TPA_asm: hypothetical protein [Caudoviricetes sp.]